MFNCILYTMFSDVAEFLYRNSCFLLYIGLYDHRIYVRVSSVIVKSMSASSANHVAV